MAHNRDIPIAFSYLPERRKWDSVTFSKAETPAPGKPTHGNFFGLATVPLSPTLLEQAEKRFRLHFPGKIGILRNTTVSLYSDETTAYMEGVTDITRKDWIIPESFTHLLVSWPDVASTPREANPWTMRDEFLRLPETNDALLGFLNRWGVWDHLDGFYEMDGRHGPLRQSSPMAVLPALVWNKRKDLKEAMLGGADDWLTERVSLSRTHRRERYPYLGITDRSCSKAIETTITLDHLSKTKWRTCKRADCDNIFPVESDHGKVYCQNYCAHLTSVRRKRAAAKRAKSATPKKKGAK